VLVDPDGVSVHWQDHAVRERILEATYTCVARYGLEKTTVEDAAKEARVSRATVYRHFPGGRDELVREAVVWEAGRFFGRLADAVAGAGSLHEVLTETLLFAHRSVEDHAVLQHLLMSEPDRVTTVLGLDSGRLIELVRDFLGPHVGDPHAADYLARMVLSFTNRSGRWDLTSREEASRLAAQLLAGVTLDTMRRD
jgi:AcrR family transcriptional regulator